MYLWNQIKFYKLQRHLTVSEEKKIEFTRKHRLWSAFVIFLVMLSIAAFSWVFFDKCKPLKKS